MAKDYTSYTKENLIEEIKSLQKRKKYGLVWEGKSEDVVEECKENLPVLNEAVDKAIIKDKTLPVNLLIEGDNYHALSVLNYTHYGKIDVIYIDPPYNTGAKDWKYNNNFVDEEDPYRHTKWLSFMAHRLIISKNLLSKEGIICVTIDDNEAPRLWLLMEEIFGEKNFLGSVVIRINPGGRKSKRKIAAQHEYALFFAKNKGTNVSSITIDPNLKSHSYKLDDKGDWYEERNLRKEGADSLAKPGSDRYYPIYFDPESKKLSTKNKLPVKIWPIDTNKEKRIWRRSKNIIDEMYKHGELFAKNTKYGLQVYFKFLGGLKGETPKSFWDDVKYSASEHGTQILDSILGMRESFNFPKSLYATADCIKVASTNKNAVVLDFFAGSGTTGHSVMLLNKRDKGKRQFILCTNNENKIAEDVCYPRIKKTIKGVKSLPDITGIPANVRYFKTSFVSKSKVSDDTRRELVKKSTEMICIRENTFEKIEDKEGYKIYKDSNHTTGILFNLDSLDSLKVKLKEQKLPSHIYVFSLTNDTFNEDFEDLSLEYELCPIPESILEVYRKLFK